MVSFEEVDTIIAGWPQIGLENNLLARKGSPNALVVQQSLSNARLQLDNCGDKKAFFQPVLAALI